MLKRITKTKFNVDKRKEKKFNLKRRQIKKLSGRLEKLKDDKLIRSEKCKVCWHGRLFRPKG